MQISFKHQTTEIKNSNQCVVTTHGINDQMIDFVIAKIDGRYPDEKRVINKLCKEMVYIQNGSGKIVVDGKEFSLNAGDLILLEPGEKYYWEGNMEVYIACSPAWTKEQHYIVD